MESTRGSCASTATAISIKPAPTTPRSLANSSTPSSSTSTSLLSKSMQASMKHEVFDLNARYGSSPIIHTASGQGFLWNREVFLRDELYYHGYAAHKLREQQQQQEERVVTHDIVLDDEELMFQ